MIFAFLDLLKNDTSEFTYWWYRTVLLWLLLHPSGPNSLKSVALSTRGLAADWKVVLVHQYQYDCFAGVATVRINQNACVVCIRPRNPRPIFSILHTQNVLNLVSTVQINTLLFPIPVPALPMMRCFCTCRKLHILVKQQSHYHRRTTIIYYRSSAASGHCTPRATCYLAVYARHFRSEISWRYLLHYISWCNTSKMLVHTTYHDATRPKC